jgi:hypothetical protein
MERKMNVLRIQTQLQMIGSAALDARARLDNGDSTGVRRSLAGIEKSMAAINDELDGAILDSGNAVEGPYEDIDAMSDAVMWKKPRA